MNTGSRTCFQESPDERKAAFLYVAFNQLHPPAPFLQAYGRNKTRKPSTTPHIRHVMEDSAGVGTAADCREYGSSQQVSQVFRRYSDLIEACHFRHQISVSARNYLRVSRGKQTQTPRTNPSLLDFPTPLLACSPPNLTATLTQKSKEQSYSCRRSLPSIAFCMARIEGGRMRSSFNFNSLRITQTNSPYRGKCIRISRFSSRVADHMSCFCPRSI